MAETQRKAHSCLNKKYFNNTWYNRKLKVNKTEGKDSYEHNFTVVEMENPNVTYSKIVLSMTSFTWLSNWPPQFCKTAWTFALQEGTALSNGWLAAKRPGGDIDKPSSSVQPQLQLHTTLYNLIKVNKDTRKYSFTFNHLVKPEDDN